jgi:hypothetical protein
MLFTSKRQVLLPNFQFSFAIFNSMASKLGSLVKTENTDINLPEYLPFDQLNQYVLLNYKELLFELPEDDSDVSFLD